MKRLATFLSIVILAQACNNNSPPPKGSVNIAEAEIHPASGSQVEGSVRFVKVDNGVRVTADVVGLKPGPHGFHIHEKGDCSAHDASSAGGHFNPSHEKHGAPTDQHRHAGDLGNIEADANGHAHYDWTDTVIELDGPNSIVGKSVVIHEKVDDFKTQPTGDAGGRIGCGVITIHK